MEGTPGFVAGLKKGYWIICVKAVFNAQSFSDIQARFASLMKSGRAPFKIVCLGAPKKVWETCNLATTVVEFESTETAVAYYNHPDYVATRMGVEKAALRDFRVIEGWTSSNPSIRSRI
jgi:uncharacterized protein (DUF1330 family)